MLDDQYWRDLGEPSPDRLLRLPIWARTYICSLRGEALWWHLASTGRPRSRRRIVPEPSEDRLGRLPLFAADWIRTLQFEVWWWRQQTFKRYQPIPTPALKETA